MIAVGVLLIVLGAFGVVIGGNMIGDIGVACLVGAVAAIISGIGFLVTSSRIKKLENKQNN